MLNVGRYLELAREALATRPETAGAIADATMPAGPRNEGAQHPPAPVPSYEKNERNEKSPGTPASWHEGVARLATMPRPAGFGAAEWATLVIDVERLLRDWGAKAYGLGWPTWSLFGCHGRAPRWRCDGMGLAMLLHGWPVVLLTETEAAIRTPSGNTLTYRRPARDPLHPAERALLWELG